MRAVLSDKAVQPGSSELELVSCTFSSAHHTVRSRETAARNMATEAAVNGETNGKERLRKELAVVRLGVTDRRRRLGLIKRVASLVLLAHPINNEHDDCDGQNQSDDGQADTHCNNTTVKNSSISLTKTTLQHLHV